MIRRNFLKSIIGLFLTGSVVEKILPEENKVEHFYAFGMDFGKFKHLIISYDLDAGVYELGLHRYLNFPREFKLKFIFEDWVIESVYFNMNPSHIPIVLQKPLKDFEFDNEKMSIKFDCQETKYEFRVSQITNYDRNYKK